MTEGVHRSPVEYETERDVDFILDMRREYLQKMLMVTLWALPLVAFSALISIKDTANGFIGLMPLVGIGAFAGGAYYLLDKRNSYDWAALFYILSLMVGMALAMIIGRLRFPLLREISPFTLTLIASAAGLLLSDKKALVVTGVGLLWIFLFSTFERTGWQLLSYDVAALLFAIVAAGIANVTAGSLYLTTHYAVESYLRTRERADEFWRNKEDLRKALATQDWLNQELKKTNQALERRALQLQTSSEVGKQVTFLLRLEELLPQVVELIRERFGYYFVGVWMISQSELALSSGIDRQGQMPVHSNFTLSLSSEDLVAEVARTGELQLVEQLTEQPAYLVSEQVDARTRLAIPLHARNRTIGVLDILSTQIGGFDENDRMVLQTLADQIAIAIRNAQLYAAEKNRRRLAESLEKTGRVLSSSLDLREMPARILEQLDAVVPYGRGSVLIQEGNHLISFAQRGFPKSHQREGFSVPIREGDVYQKIVKSHEPIIINDVTQDPRFQHVEGLTVHHSWMGVPLMTKDRVIGMMSLTRQEKAAFTPTDVQLVQAFAGQAAIALENASLYDEITRFNEELEQRVQERTDELNRAYNLLELLDEHKSDFIRVAAHELRTPLTVIKGYTQVLRSGGNVSEDSDMYPVLQGILTGTERLHTIVNSMLDVAMIDSQTINMVKLPLLLNEVMQRVDAAYYRALEERNLTMSFEGFDELPEVEADPNLIYRVFENLISNAIKYTPDGGQIRVIGRPLGDVEPEAVEVVVSDTGIGIDREYHELIFEKFYQMGEVQFHSSSRTKFQGGGPGLGLAIVRGIVEAHKGRVWVESLGSDEETCPGSDFHVLLPLATEEEQNG